MSKRKVEYVMSSGALAAPLRTNSSEGLSSIPLLRIKSDYFSRRAQAGGTRQRRVSLKLLICVLPMLLLTRCSRAPKPAPLLPTSPVVVNGHRLPERWILVDTRSRTLFVMREAEPAATFSEVAMGSGGAGIKRRRGDQVTPIGEFRITSISPSERFRLFVGLDYPTIEYGERAHREGLITQRELQRIRTAHHAGKVPPDNTALGGGIGIHGLGPGDPRLHRILNWTAGCLALTNEQMYNLRPMIDVGMLVKIR